MIQKICFQYDMRVEFRPRLDEPPPYGLVVRKGEKNVAITRKFAEFCIHSRIAIELVNWLQSLFFSDELFYSTLVTVTSFNDKVSKIERSYQSRALEENCVFWLRRTIGLTSVFRKRW